MIIYVSAKQLPDDGSAIEHDRIPFPFDRVPHHDLFLHPSDDDSSDKVADRDNECIDPEQCLVWTQIHGTPHLDKWLASKPRS